MGVRGLGFNSEGCRVQGFWGSEDVGFPQPPKSEHYCYNITGS